MKEIEDLAVELAMVNGFQSFRPVQRMCCEEVVKDVHRQIVVKATMGSGKTKAMVASILSMHHVHADKEAPLCFVVVKQKNVGERLLTECMRMLPNHDIFTNFEDKTGDLKCWVKRDDGLDYEELDQQNLVDVLLDRDQWLVCTHQSEEQPLSSAPSERASSMSFARNQRVFMGKEHKRRRLYKSSDQYKQPNCLSFDAWMNRDEKRPATIITTYTNLEKVLCHHFKGALTKSQLTMFDESHNVANNTKSCRWKETVTRLCQVSERIYMFSGTPIAIKTDDSILKEGSFLDEFRCKAFRILWTEKHALEAGEIVPTQVVPMPGAYLYSWLQAGNEKQKLYNDVSQEFKQHFKEAHEDSQVTEDCISRSIPMALAQIVLVIGSSFAQTMKFLERPGESAVSPCSNILLMVRDNDLGDTTAHIVKHILKHEDAKRLWLRSFVCCHLEKDDMMWQNISEMVDTWFERLCAGVRTFCPNDNQKLRMEALDNISKWEQNVEPCMHILVATRWPAEGVDIEHLHGVAPWPTRRYKDNTFDQLRSRSGRAATKKKSSYLFMLEHQSVKGGGVSKVVDNADTLATPIADVESNMQDLVQDESIDVDMVLASTSSEMESQRGHLEVMREDSDRCGDTHASDNEDDSDCQGAEITFSEALARAIVHGGCLSNCCLMSDSESSRLKQKVDGDRRQLHVKSPTELWTEQISCTTVPKDIPIAIVVLHEQKKSCGHLIVAGILSPSSHELSASNLKSTFGLDYIYGEEMVPSYQKLQELVLQHLDGSKHGFLWTGTNLMTCSSNTKWHGNRVVKIRDGELKQRSRPIDLVNENTLERPSCIKLARVVKERYLFLQDFNYIDEAFVLGSSLEVLTISAKGSTTGHFGMSTDEVFNVNYLCVAIPFDLASRPSSDTKEVKSEVTRRMKDLRARACYDKRERKGLTHLQTAAVAVPYQSEVVILAVITHLGNNGEARHGIVHLNPQRTSTPYTYCNVIGLKDRWCFPFQPEWKRWQILDHCFNKNEFKICDLDGHAWKWHHENDDVNKAACHLIDSEEGSVFTYHTPGQDVTPKFKLNVGGHACDACFLAIGKRPISLRMNDHGCCRGPAQHTQIFLVPSHMMQEKGCILSLTEQCTEAFEESSSCSNSKGRGYFAASLDFSPAKHAGKDKVNRILSKYGDVTGFAIILDDIDPRTGNLRTAEKLLADGYIADHILIPNFSLRVCKKARERGFRATSKPLIAALDDADINPSWRKLVKLAYYDNCVIKKWDEIENNVAKLDLFMAPGGIFACTLLGRNLAGDTLVNRKEKLDALMASLGYLNVKEDGILRVEYCGNLVLFYKKDVQ